MWYIYPQFVTDWQTGGRRQALHDMHMSSGKQLLAAALQDGIHRALMNLILRDGKTTVYTSICRAIVWTIVTITKDKQLANGSEGSDRVDSMLQQMLCMLNEDLEIDGTFQLSFTHIRSSPSKNGTKCKIKPTTHIQKPSSGLNKPWSASRIKLNCVVPMPLWRPKPKWAVTPTGMVSKRDGPFLKKRKVVEIWECQLESIKWEKEEVRTFVDTVKFVAPLDPQDAFSGGHANAVRLCHCPTVENREELRYYDFTLM